jgi:toxin ParE1/3/4
MLGERPHMGRKCDHLAKDVRSFPMGEYIIYYKHLRGTTWILHVFHGARDQRKGFGKT